MLKPHHVTSSDLEHARLISRRLAVNDGVSGQTEVTANSGYVDFDASAMPVAEPDYSAVGENTASGFEHDEPRLDDPPCAAVAEADDVAVEVADALEDYDEPAEDDQLMATEEDHFDELLVSELEGGSVAEGEVVGVVEENEGDADFDDLVEGLMISEED
jgi:hypothetical protein